MPRMEDIKQYTPLNGKLVKELIENLSGIKPTLFGYIPNKTPWNDLVLRIVGYPSMIRRIQAPVIMRMLKLKEDEVVLDAGCGGGFFTCEIAKRCKMSIDIDWNLSKGLSFVMGKQPKVAYVRGDVQRLPFASEKFDKILLSSVLQMVRDDKAVLKNCHRILKGKGVLVLSVPIEYCYLKKLNRIKPQLKKRFGAQGKTYYDYDEVIELLRNEGFGIMETKYSPKKWGSLIFEIGIFLWYHFCFPFFSSFLFPVLYPIAYFDKFADSKQRGNELVIKVRRAPR